MNYDKLCFKPESEILKLLEFLNIDKKTILDELVKLIKKPPSIGRYKSQDLSIFNNDQIQSVKKMGFDVNA